MDAYDGVRDGRADRVVARGSRRVAVAAVDRDVAVGRGVAVGVGRDRDESPV
jgi:hypothetical protein